MAKDQEAAAVVSIVLDTNAIIDALSLHGLEKALERAQERGIESVFEDMHSAHRLKRWAAGTLFVWGCRDQGLAVGCAIAEMQQQVESDAEAEEEGGLAAIYAQFVAHMYFDFLLPPFDFRNLSEIPDGLLTSCAPTVSRERNDAVDDALLQIAQKNDVLLVTNECWGMRGIKSKKGQLRTKAIEQNVNVRTTLEWLHAEVESLETLAKDFLLAYDKAAERFLEQRTHVDDAPSWLGMYRELYNEAFTRMDSHEELIQ